MCFASHLASIDIRHLDGRIEQLQKQAGKLGRVRTAHLRVALSAPGST